VTANYAQRPVSGRDTAAPSPAVRRTPRAPSDRSAAQIEADLAATRDRLTASVQALIDQVHPNRIKQRQIANVKRLANAELENAKSLLFNARGDLRTDRVTALAGAAAGLLTFVIIVRAIVRRGRRGRRGD
jgi:hypothetical protein